MPRIALATAIDHFAHDDDLAPLVAAFAEADVRADIVAWDDPTVSWARFDAVLLRSPWDYTQRLREFLGWCERVSAVSALFNPLDVVRWNTDKRYLADLAQAGVAIVESVFLAPGEDPAAFPDYGEFVVKPTVSAGSRDTQRYVREERDDAVAHAQRLLDAGREVLVQPYLDGVDAQGETALIYFGGAFSHAIRKSALLSRGGATTSHLASPDRIAPCEPGAAERDVAARIIAALPAQLGLDRAPLYARVDLLPSADGPKLLELELTEPALFFYRVPNAAPRLVEALLARLGFTAPARRSASR